MDISNAPLQLGGLIVEGYLTAIKAQIRANPVFFMALLIAVITSIIIPPDSSYLQYFDFRTLTCLFCILAVICAFNNINFFLIVARNLVSHFSTARSIILVLVYITLIGSMFITNDMALIIFLPLAYFVLESTDRRELLAFTFIMQNFAANLGGMLTPFGNPQNLYLYSFYNIGYGSFISVMFFPFLLSVVLITACCWLVKDEPLVLNDECKQLLDLKKVVVYTTLFTISVIIVFRGIPYGYGLIIIPLTLLVFDRKALKDVDYFLLLTFVAFFVFAGNVARIPLTREFLQAITEQSTLLSGIITSQFISNVPSAILLSHFTSNYADLLVAVNIGGVGTLVASLASLITFREYSRHNSGKQMFFIKKFTVYNFAFLVILTVVCICWLG